ncbi:serine--tRNA ligase, partial [Enterococcus faecalis]
GRGVRGGAGRGVSAGFRPFLVPSNAMFGSGQFPMFKEDVFQVADSDVSVIPSAVLRLTYYNNNEILDAEELPIYFTALS